MNTTDIQRYPDNYEVLSTDAALRAERITCRLRHLIYATTSIKKEEYLRSAETMQGIEISENGGILEIKLPCLLPKRRQRQSTEFLLDPFKGLASQAPPQPPLLPAVRAVDGGFNAGGCGVYSEDFLCNWRLTSVKSR